MHAAFRRAERFLSQVIDQHRGHDEQRLSKYDWLESMNKVSAYGAVAYRDEVGVESEYQAAGLGYKLQRRI